MASIKVVLAKHKKKKDGSIPIAIRIIKNRSARYIFTGEYILEKHWNDENKSVKKLHPNANRLNLFIQKKLSEVHSTLLEAESSDKNLTTTEIKKKIKRTSSNVSFFQLGAERIESKHLAGTYSVANAELSILYNIEEFLSHKKTGTRQSIIDDIKKRRKERLSYARKHGRNVPQEVKYFNNLKKLSFDDIDTAFIAKFKVFCTSYLEQKTRTVTNQLIFIRTLYNLAIKEQITDGKNYPFAGDKEKIRIGSGNKIGLTKDEIKSIEDLKLDNNSTSWHTKNVWLFSYYFAGVRISDVLELKWGDFIDDRLYYQMNKNEKPVSLKIPEQAMNILKFYEHDKASNDDFVFPFLKKANLKDPEDVFRKSRNATKLLNSHLKRIASSCEIEKNLSNHIARHSFGNIAGSKIHPRKLQKLYRHGDLKTTLNYQANFIHDELDEALDTVLNS